MIPPSPPPAVAPSAAPAIVSGCGSIRHDGMQRTTAVVLSSAANAVMPVPAFGVGNAAAQSAGDATVWTELKADVENPGALTIVGLRLGVHTTEGGYTVLDVPVTIAPNGAATAKQQLARGTTQVGVDSCNLVRVNFSDGTYWYAPQPVKP
jgi:hypothetical protein